MVRIAVASQEWLGLGTAVSRPDGADRGRPNREGSRAAVRAGDRLARPAPWDVQVPVQLDLLAVGQAGREGVFESGQFESKKLFAPISEGVRDRFVNQRSEGSV